MQLVENEYFLAISQIKKTGKRRKETEEGLVKKGEELQALASASGDKRDAVWALQVQEASGRVLELEKHAAEVSEVLRSARQEAAKPGQETAQAESAEQEIVSLRQRGTEECSGGGCLGI